MDLPGLIVLFARVVDAGSFSAASRELNQSPSAVSKQIAHLEDRAGVRLLNRSKDGVSLTDEGDALYRRCACIRRDVEAAADLVASFRDKPEGYLRIAATVAFGKSQVLPTLPAFLDRYPDVRVSVDLSDRRIDLAGEQIDVAIQFTEQIEDQSLYARKLAHNRRILCAAPAYLERFGAPANPEDLQQHNCLQLSTVSRFNEWNIGDRAADALPLDGNFEASSTDALYHATLAGLGVARLSTYLVGEDVKAGRLVRLLPGYEDNGSDIFAVYAARRNLPTKVRVFIDHLVAAFLPVPPWERDGDLRDPAEAREQGRGPGSNTARSGDAVCP